MDSKTIIFNSESEFRRYVILNSKDISHIFVFEDVLDRTIFFYCITCDFSIVATKEPLIIFSFYRKIYQQLAPQLGLHVAQVSNQQNILKLVR